MGVNDLEIQKTLALLHRDLREFGPQLSRTVPGFRHRYAPVLEAYDAPFRAARMSGNGAFVVDAKKRQLTINLGAIEQFHKPIDQFEAEGEIPAAEAAIARQIAVEQLTVHEITHIADRLIEMSDVQHFKHLVGRQALGEADIIADAGAARICARLEMLRAQEKGWANYASRIEQQLFVMGQFAFKAFKSPKDKPHKRQRFLGLAMMTAVAHDHLLRKKGPSRKAGELPLGTPLFPYFDKKGALLICAFTPDRTVWGRRAFVDAKLLRDTCDGLDNKPFATTVARARNLLAQFGTIQIPTAEALPDRMARIAKVGKSG